MLIAAWLNVNLDQVVGMNQTRLTYWARITEFFHTHKTFESYRNESSLIYRWQTIQAEVNKFCGYYDGVMRRAPSGSTDINKVRFPISFYLVMWVIAKYVVKSVMRPNCNKLLLCCPPPNAGDFGTG